jgi:putative tricarboxylic transport membrane protein
VTPEQDQTGERTLPDERGAPRSGVLGLRITGVVILAFGAVVLWQSLQIEEGGGYTAVGPAFFPLIVSAGLLAFGALFLLRATVWPDAYLLARAAAERAGTHWPTPFLLAILLVAYAFALDPLGYVPATVLFVPLGSRILGSRALPRDLVTGTVIAVVLYVGFTRYLGVRLPAGLLEPVLG